METRPIRGAYFMGTTKIDIYRYGYEILDGDIGKVRAIDLTVDGGKTVLQDLSNHFEWGRPVREEFVPKRIVKNGPHREQADVEALWGTHLVSEKFKVVVESVEPNVHQFFPVELTWENGEPVGDQYYIFVVCNRIDSVNRRHSLATLNHKNGIDGFWRMYDIPKESHAKAIVFDLSTIGSRHIWCDAHMTKGPFMSDVFVAAAEKAGLVGFFPKIESAL